MKKRLKNPTFYVIPIAQIDAFRGLLRSMQAAMDEIFEESYLPVEIYKNEIKAAEAEFRNKAVAIISDKDSSLDLEKLF